MNIDVKICGLQSGEVLKSLSKINLNIDYLGFVFAPSKRQVSVSQFASIYPFIPDTMKSVGVFVDPDMDLLIQIMNQSPLDVIQLHGNESSAFCKEVKERLNVDVWKSWSIETGKENKMPEPSYADYIDVLLLDTYSKSSSGGTGKTFDWEAIPSYIDWTRGNNIKLFVAGGVHADNVQALIDYYPIDGIDVSSGVESNGAKDLSKIVRLVERVKGNVRSRN